MVFVTEDRKLTFSELSNRCIPQPNRPETEIRSEKHRDYFRNKKSAEALIYSSKWFLPRSHSGSKSSEVWIATTMADLSDPEEDN